MGSTRDRLSLVLTLALGAATALSACAPKAPPAADRPTPRPGAVPTRPPAVAPGPDAALISNKGGGVISHDGGALAGTVRIPAAVVASHGGRLISNKGGGVVANGGADLISNKGGGLAAPGKATYGLRAGEDAPLVGFPVTIVDARGAAVVDEAGAPYATTTDAGGAFRFARAPRGANLVVRVALPDEVGAMLAYLPDAPPRAAREAAVDAASTLALGYVLEKFVRAQPDPNAAIQRLSGAAEAEARAGAAAALKAAPPLTGFRPEPLVRAAEALRAQDAAFDRQLEAIRRMVIGGLADVGDGELATQVAITSPIALARRSDGSWLVAERNGHRVRRIDPATGRITTFAGKNGGTEAGDGGPATDAFIQRPVALAVDRQDNVYLLEHTRRALRRIDAMTGVITTVTGAGPSPAAAGMRAADARYMLLPYSVVVDAADRPVFCTGDGVFRVEADGRLTAIAQPPEGGDPPHLRMLAVGPDGTIHAFFGQTGLLTRLEGDALVPVADAPRLPVAGSRFEVGEARFALGPDGRAYVLDGDAIWTLPPGGAWARLPFDPPHGELWALLPLADGLLVCDGERNRVWRLPPGGGTATLVAGLAAVTADEVAAEALTLNRPTSLLVDAQGDLLVADALNNLVWRRMAGGRYQRFAGGTPALPTDTEIGDGGPAREARLLAVLGLTLLRDGTVLIGEAMPPVYRLRAIAPDGTITTRRLPEGLQAPAYLAEEADGGLLASDYLARKVYRWKGDRAEPAFAGDGIRQPGKLIVRADGSVLVADPEGCAIWHVVAGVPTRLVGGNGPGFGGDGGPAAEARLNNPVDMLLAANGDLYVADFLNDRVRRVRAATGMIETIAGAGGVLLAGTGPDDSLKEPTGLAFDRAGNLFVADSGHNQIKVLSASQLR